MKPVMFIGAWYLKVSPRMITCREFNELIYDYTEDLLNDQQSIIFKRHMKYCPMCRNFLKTYVATYKAGDASFPHSDLQVPKAVPKRLLDVISVTPNDST